MKSHGNADGDEDAAEEDEGKKIQVFNDNELQIIIDNLKYKPNQDNTFNVMILLDIVTRVKVWRITRTKEIICNKRYG